MGRLIDADVCLHKAWQNFYKQENEHEKNIDGYDIMRDQFYEQSGFECCQQTIVNAPTVEAILKADYEARLKADLIAMLDKIRAEIIKYEGDCRLSVDEYPSCKQCTDNVFESIYAILEKYKAESEDKECVQIRNGKLKQL